MSEITVSASETPGRCSTCLDCHPSRRRVATVATRDADRHRGLVQGQGSCSTRVLDATCHDELVTALGRDETQRTNVTHVQRWLRHVVDGGAHRIRKHVN